MKTRPLTLAAGLLLAAASSSLVQGAIIIADNYNTSNTNSGFALGNGVNSGINPSPTRLTGSAAAGLRYFKYSGIKADTAHTITGNKMRIDKIATDSSTLALSPNGTAVFDFGTALNSTASTPGLPSVYDVTIDVANQVTSNQRCSFAISSTAGTAGAWDFGIQLYHAATGDAGYTLQKRIGTAASGVAALNTTITTVGTHPNAVSFLIHITDAGAESTTYNSRVQVYVNSTNLVYDTATDTDLPNGWRFPTASRFIYWDVAGGAGPVLFDNFSLNYLSGPTTGTRTWTGSGSDNLWSTTPNWDSSAPATGDTIVFSGSNRLGNTNDITGLIVPSLSFLNDGFSLYGNAVTVSGVITNLAGTNAFYQDLAWSSAANKSWMILTNSQLVLSNTTTVEVNGDHAITGGGTLLLKNSVMNIGQATTANPAFVVNNGQFVIDGGTLNSRGGYRLGSLTNGTAVTILTNNALLKLTASTANFRLGDNTNSATSQLIMDNSTLTMSGIFTLPYSGGSTSVVSQTGGTFSGGILSFNDNGVGKGTYTVKNGVVEVTQIRKNTSGGSSTMNFDNATLRPAVGATNATFFSGLNSAVLQAGGLVLDATSDVTIAQVLSGAGSLTKSNAAAITLTGANTYSGPTLVQSGKLFFSNVQSNSTAVTVADAAELGVVAKTAGKTLNVPSIQFAGVSYASFNFDLGVLPTPTAPLIKVGSLSANSPITVNILNGLQLTTGTIVLVDYDGAIGGGFQFALGSLPAGVSATLVDNTENSSIDLVVTGVPGYRWTGAVNGDWDYGAQNWINQQTSGPDTYLDGFPIEFFDSATTGNVSINIFPTPSLITVSNNTLPYVWSNGALTVSTIKKFGTNSLTRVESAPDIITNLELNAGSYIVSNSSPAGFSTILTDVTAGTGTFVKKGGATLTITSTNNTYDGSVVIAEGMVKITADRALGAVTGSTTISSGTTLDLNDTSPGAEPIFVSGAGTTGQGAIIDSTTTGTVDANLRDVTMLGDTVFGVPTGGRWDLRIRSGTGVGPGLRGNGFNLTKVGSGTVSIACQRSLGTNTPYWDMNLGDVIVNAGSLAFAESLTLGNPSKTITVNAGASLQLYDLNITNPILRNIFLTDSRLNCGGAATDTNVINGTISITGSTGFKPDLAVLILNGPVVGTGTLGISANDPGRVYFNGVNTFAGDTIVTNGLIGGTGVIAGNLIMQAGTNAPGMAGVGKLTVNGNATLAGNTTMELNRNLGAKSDQLSVGGTLTFGGSLTVVLAAGAPAPQAGDVYPLFNKGGSGSFSPISLPNLSALPGGLAWDTSKLTVNGTISVTGTATPPSITGVSVSGTNFIFNGTGGVEGSSYTVLSSPDVALPVSSWTPVSTNVFGSGGVFSYTNGINPATPASFYLLRVP